MALKLRLLLEVRTLLGEDLGGALGRKAQIDEGRPARLIHTIRGVGFLCGAKPLSGFGKVPR